MFDPFFAWLEATAFSVWMRESPSVFAFPIILAVHTIGLGMLAGINVALNLRILGFAARVPLDEFRRFFPFLWLGLWLNIFSGLALLAAYPTKALTNPIFYVKLGLIAVALVILRSLRQVVTTGADAPAAADGRIGSSGSAASYVALAAVSPSTIVGIRRAKTLAAMSLVCWAGTIAAGRFLAYTHIRLMVDSIPIPRAWAPWVQ
jgi:energy-coupling factor transporter transmembrane protein EcfT